ncbi:MAG: glycosyltransferase family 4 protein [Candidatus Scalindua sp.]|nr:glycosyltransferase family 4 protein [Candidatus Scalindua sp.]
MRILYHHRTLGDGAEGIHIREMVKAFREIGYEVLVIGPLGETSDNVSKKASVLYKIKNILPGFFYELLELGYNLIGFINIYKNIKSFRPDFIYDRYITFNVSSVFLGKYFGIPVINEVNAPLSLERSTQPDEQLYFKKLAHFLEKWICLNATKTIAVSSPLAEYYHYRGVPQTKLVVMPNGVDKEKFQPHSKSKLLLNRLGINNGEIIIGFSGILRSWHGIDILIKTVARLVEREIPVFLLIVGDGPLRQDIETWTRDSGIGEHYKITGRIAHSQVPEFVNLFDVAVSPRSTFYASPMKLIEYMALGKAVVIPNCANFLDIVDPGINGILFDENDVGSLTNAITKLCKDVSFRREIGLNARLKVEKRLNWEWNAREVCRLATL